MTESSPLRPLAQGISHRTHTTSGRMTDDDRRLRDYLQSFLTPRRLRRFEQVLAHRTRWITVVLEDLYDAHNIGAIARSCDAFGVQDVHVIEVSHPYEPQPETALGSQQWVTVHRYQEAPDPRRVCIDALRSRGYRIAVTTLDSGASPPEEIDLAHPVAIVFGTEKDGVTPAMLNDADIRVGIPMHGFVQSFNVSVAAALCLHALTTRLRHSEADWRLSAEEIEELRFHWTRISVPNVEQIERRYYEMRKSGAAGSGNV